MGKAAVIIAVVSGIADFILNKFFTELPKFVLKYASGILSVAASLFVDMIVKKEFAFSVQALYGGILAASFGKLLSFTLIKIINGEKPDENAIITLIEGLLFNYIPCGNLKKTATEIAEVVKAITEPDLNSPETEKKIVEILLRNAESVTESEADFVSKLILTSVYSLKD